MENKPVNQKPRKKNEFRYHDIPVISKRGKKRMVAHPTYVYLKKENIYVYVPITHSPFVRHSKVIKLRKNPNPRDKRASYRVIGIKEDSKEMFSKVRKGWKIDPEDEADIRNEYKKRWFCRSDSRLLSREY